MKSIINTAIVALTLASGTSIGQVQAETALVRPFKGAPYAKQVISTPTVKGHDFTPWCAKGIANWCASTKNADVKK